MTGIVIAAAGIASDRQGRYASLHHAVGGVVMAGPGDVTAAADGRDRDGLRASHADRELVIGALKAAFVQGRLTEAEHDERTAQASASRSRAELAALTADLPDGLTALPPTARDVRIGIGMIIAAAGALAAILLTNPDNILAFLAALGAIA